ncbi:MAG: hypothetical protein K8S97_04420 [Anaerolineae bacterium]|nr:hypothetical protein [Anaerolineae bacterium]
MVEFVAFDPQVEVKGAALLATLAGVDIDVTPILERHGITDVSTDHWYPQQAWLDVLKNISHLPALGTLGLVSIGMRIPENADWPEGIDSIEAALNSIDVAYQMNHRNGAIGSYRAERISDSLIRVTCENPYPSDFDYGIVYGVIKCFVPDESQFTVERAESPNRQAGDDACVYNVTLG